MAERDVYLTVEGRDRLAAELEDLITARRPEIENALRRAKESGGRDENVDFEEAKDEQGFVEGRIHELQRLLADAVLIEKPPVADYVRLGSRVSVRDEAGDTESYEMVGSQEADPRKRLISNESPIGRALLGRRPGDEVTVVAPGGSFTLQVESIS